jgi:hypothetical protein
MLVPSLPRSSTQAFGKVQRAGSCCLNGWSLSLPIFFVACCGEGVESFVLAEDVADGSDGFPEVIVGACGGLPPSDALSPGRMDDIATFTARAARSLRE